MEQFLTGLAAVSLAAWIWLLFLRGGFWKCSEMLNGAGPEPAEWPTVVAIVPARNEAEVIGRAIERLSAQDYPGSFSIIVVDDDSDDGTADAARAADDYAARALDLVTGETPPAGWTGKMWALHAGLARADKIAADATLVWFTDADIEHDPDTLRRLVAKAEAGAFDLVSTMVLLHCRSFWERLLIPPFVFFFQKLYPFPRVNDPASPVAAAAGGCMLVRRGALMRIGGIAAIRNELIDDCALARAIKRQGPIWLGLTRASRSIRPYSTLAPIWSMVARTAFHQLGYSALLLAGTVAGMVMLYGVPPLAVFGAPLYDAFWTQSLGTLTYFTMGVVFWPTARLYGQSAIAVLLLPVAALFYVAMCLDSARRHWIGRGGTWKARHHAPETSSAR